MRPTVGLSPGFRLGPYEIVASVGAGGMGEVYKARDTRLGRDVAVKVLPPRLSSSPEARQRFEREAKTISRLSHPHICSLYDVGNQDGVEYIVMELLEGETLAERLARGALPLEQTLRYGQEIADALDKAHRQGIVHRDLKPANVMLTKSGVKLLDFGLAKAVEPRSAPGEVTSLPTQQELTAEGTILGTFQYMAPEQLEAKEADSRTDIFAFGALLYEMATGRKAFTAASQASLITAIMSSDPPSISSVQPMSPAALDRIVRTCLAKEPEERWQSAADIKRELKWIGEGSAAGVALPATVGARRRRRERMAWLLAALGVLVGAAGLWRSRGSAPTKPELMAFTIPPPPGNRFQDVIALSPDGRRILMLILDASSLESVWIRGLDELGIRRLPGTEGARFPFWSPDGREIAFFSSGKLMRLSAQGGPVQTICDSGSGFGGVWGRDGTILFTPEFGSPIVAVSASGGTPRPVTTLDAARGEVTHFFPSFLPDGRHFVFVARNLDADKTEIRVGSLDSRESRSLLRADTAALYADPGYLVFARGSAVFAQRFDPSNLRLTGEAVPAFEGVRYGTEDNRLSASAASGRFAYLQWPQRRRLVWVDRKGREIGTVGEVACYEDMRLSADGRRVAVSRRDPSRGQNLDLWVVDAVRGTSSRITSERSDEMGPAWFPDGEHLVFVSDRGGSGFYDLYEVAASGGPAKTLIQTKHDKTQVSVSRDGRSLVFLVSENARYRRQILSVGAGGEPRDLGSASRFTEGHPEISPDGRWTSFDTNESGNREVFVEPLTGGPKKQVSVGGGHSAIWRADGRELFYMARDGALMSVPIRESGAGNFEAGEPQPLFLLQAATDPAFAYFRRPFDVAPDGERFLVVRRAPDDVPEDAAVVLNWTAVLAGKEHS